VVESHREYDHQEGEAKEDEPQLDEPSQAKLKRWIVVVVASTIAIVLVEAIVVTVVSGGMRNYGSIGYRSFGRRRRVNQSHLDSNLLPLVNPPPLLFTVPPSLSRAEQKDE